MRNIKELFDKGLAVLPVEIRGAKKDSFSYVSKKTGLKVEVHLVRLSLEVEVLGNIESADGSIDQVEVPAWAARGARMWIGCSEVKRENRRMVCRIVEAIPEKETVKA